MNIPPKYEDVVARLDAALGREASANNIVAGQRTSLDVCAQQINTLQQRLTVAEQRADKFGLLLRDVSGRGRVVLWEIGLMDQIDDALGHDGFCEYCCGSGWANQGCVDLCTSCGGTGMSALKPAAEVEGS